MLKEGGGMSMLPRATSLFALCALTACGAHGDAVDLDSYFAAQPYAMAGCDAVDTTLAGRREMRLYYNGGVDVGTFTRGLQRYYRRRGLLFSTDRPGLFIEPGYALDSDQDAMLAAARMVFPGVNLDDEATLMRDPELYERVVVFALNFHLRPAIEFAREHSGLGANVTNLVVVPQIPSTGSTSLALDGGGALAGFAISPTLVANLTSGDPDTARIWNAVELPANFSPMMFLDAGVIGQAAAREEVLRDVIVAHEFGHTAGLVHRETTHNLMFPSVSSGSTGCADWLQDDQIAVVRGTLGVGAGQAPTAGQALTAEEAREAAAVRWSFPPARWTALVRGDRSALRTLLAPFFDAVP
jgi:hypothetical protein